MSVLRDSQFLLWAAPKNYLRFSVAQALMPGTRIARRPPDFLGPPPASQGNRAWYLGGSIIPGINRIMQVLAYAVRWHVPEPERRAWWTSAAIQPRPSFLRDVPPASSRTKWCQQTHNPVNAWPTENEKRRGSDSAVGWHAQCAATGVVAGLTTPFVPRGAPPSQGPRTAFWAVDP